MINKEERTINIMEPVTNGLSDYPSVEVSPLPSDMIIDYCHQCIRRLYSTSGEPQYIFHIST